MDSEDYDIPDGPHWDGLERRRVANAIRRAMTAASRQVASTRDLIQSAVAAVMDSPTGRAAIAEGQSIAALVTRKAGLKTIDRGRREAVRHPVVDAMWRKKPQSLTDHLADLRSRELLPDERIAQAELETKVLSSFKATNPTGKAIAALILRHYTNKQIAEELKISESYVRRVRINVERRFRDQINKDNATARRLEDL